MANYPQFRKYAGQNTWFKIHSPEKWEELRVLGNYYNLTEYIVQNFADRNFILDLTACKIPGCESISQEEYEGIVTDSQKRLTLKSAL